MIRSRLLPALVLPLVTLGLVVGDDTKPAQPEKADKPTATEPAKKDDATRSRDEQYYEMMQVLADTFEQIERNYVKEVDRRQLVNAAIRGMMQDLEDPYSNYISPDDLSQFNQVLEQEFTGIGIQVEISPESRRLTVMSPLPNSPALKAGIRAGDVIMEIDGKSTEGMSLPDAVKLMKGIPGTPVKVGILHTGEKKLEQMTIMRAVVHLASVMGDFYNPDGTWNHFLDNDKKIAYIRLSSFSRDSHNELKETLTKLGEQGMKGLILDLRNNPGGLLNVATEIADLFLEEGIIVSTKGRNTEERVVRARKRGTFMGFPMAILVNRYSASASEVVSAALQDHKRAVVVGERTWGKGSVQNVIELEEGKSALKLTTASYHRPSGKNIHRFPNSSEADEWGVLPDDGMVVKFNDGELVKYLEYRRSRDVLASTGPPKSDYVDSQMKKAVEYVVTNLPKDGDKTAEKPAEKPEEKKDEAAKDPNSQSSLRREALPRNLELPVTSAL